MLRYFNGLSVRISADRCETWVQAEKVHDGFPRSPEEVKAVLARAGITTGIDEGGIAVLCQTPPPSAPVLVARGVPPVRGKDGWTEYRFEGPDIQPLDAADGRVDHRARSVIRNVLAGQILAVLHPAEPGVAGTAVTGETLPAVRGNAARLRAGKFTGFAPDDPACLVAHADGCAERRADGSIHVSPEITINGNVDYSTGNIDFVGSLVIRGDVAGGFSVHARGSIRIDGIVGDASIHSGKDVSIGRGFIGHGKGTVEAGGNVQVSHVVNQKIVSAGDVTIEKESVNGTILAEGSIFGTTAVIAGGSLDAIVGIKVASLGSSDDSHCKLRLGNRSRIVQCLGQVEKEIKTIEQQLKEVKGGLYRLVRARVEGQVLSERQEEALSRLQEIQNALASRREELEAERMNLQTDLRKHADARAVVLDTVHENVVLEINGARMVVSAALREAVFVEHDGAIEVQPL
jgi:uncharacterized protein (DUF342 family)